MPEMLSDKLRGIVVRTLLCAGVLLLMVGCCPSRLDSLEGLRVCGSGPGDVLVYDKDTDTLAWIDTSTMKVIVRYEHWNKK